MRLVSSVRLLDREGREKVDRFGKGIWVWYFGGSLKSGISLGVEEIIEGKKKWESKFMKGGRGYRVKWVLLKDLLI